MKKVLIVDCGDVGSEPEVLRQPLENFGYFVAIQRIGRPNDLIALLGGDSVFEPDYVILSCHGVNGELCMPALAESIYEPGEPRGNMAAADINKCLKLKGKVIINTGCMTGTEEMAKAFSKQNIYIAPKDYVEGNAAVYFLISLFYELCKEDVSLKDAFEIAKATDSETGLFEMFSKEAT